MKDWLPQLLKAAADTIDGTAPLIIISTIVGSAIVALSLYGQQPNEQIKPAYIQRYKKLERTYYTSWLLSICLASAQPIVITILNEPFIILFYILFFLFLLLSCVILIYLACSTRKPFYKSMNIQAKAKLRILEVLPIGSLALIAWLLRAIIPEDWKVDESSVTSVAAPNDLNALIVCILLIYMAFRIFWIGLSLFDIAFPVDRRESREQETS